VRAPLPRTPLLIHAAARARRIAAISFILASPRGRIPFTGIAQGRESGQPGRRPSRSAASAGAEAEAEATERASAGYSAAMAALHTVTSLPPHRLSIFRPEPVMEATDLSRDAPVFSNSTASDIDPRPRLMAFDL